MILIDSKGTQYRTTSHWQPTDGRIADSWHQISGAKVQFEPWRTHITIHQCGTMHRFIAIDSGGKYCQTFCELAVIHQPKVSGTPDDVHSS
jgi:hypothetical protein